MKEKKRILRILNRFNLGGPVYNASFLTKHLEEDFDTLLIGGEHLEDEENALYIPESLGLKPIVVPELNRSIGFKSEFQAYSRIKKIINEFAPDIVHTHASKAGAIGRLAASNCKVPYIVHTYHGHVFEHYFSSLKTSFVKATERYLAKKSDAIIVISERQKKDIVDRFKIVSESKTHVIPLGFELDKYAQNTDVKRKTFRSKFKIEDDEVVIGIIGRMAPIKNHHFFIKQIAELKKNNEKLRAVVIGDGDAKQELIDLGGQLGLKNTDVIFTSWITNLSEVLPGLDIVALTSLNEGTPVSLIEAQAAGLPVISSDVGGVANTVGKDAGFLYQSNDDQEFISKCQELISNRELRKVMGQNGRKFVMSKYTVERLASDMKKLYLQLLNPSANNEFLKL